MQLEIFVWTDVLPPGAESVHPRHTPLHQTFAGEGKFLTVSTRSGNYWNSVVHFIQPQDVLVMVGIIILDQWVYADFGVAQSSSTNRLEVRKKQVLVLCCFSEWRGKSGGGHSGQGAPSCGEICLWNHAATPAVYQVRPFCPQKAVPNFAEAVWCSG